MKIEFVILADAAQAVGGKLYVLGGGWNIYRSGSFPAQVRASIAVSLLAEPGEAHAKHTVTVTIADEGGIPIVPEIRGDVEIHPVGDVSPGHIQRVPLVVNLSHLSVPRPGRYSVTATVGASKVQVFFEALFTGKKVASGPSASIPGH